MIGSSTGITRLDQRVMSVLVDVVAWSIIAFGAISAAVGLGSLVIGPSRARRPRGVHARPHLADPGERRTRGASFVRTC